MGGILSEIPTTILTDWDTSIIAKRTHIDIPIGQNNKPQTFYCQYRGKGKINNQTCNSLMDEVYIPIQITSFEADDADSIKVLRAIKKALHNKKLTGSNGEYRITEFEFFEENKLTKLVITAYKRVLDRDSEF